jgi:hypothetical protein
MEASRAGLKCSTLILSNGATPPNGPVHLARRGFWAVAGSAGFSGAAAEGFCGAVTAGFSWAVVGPSGGAAEQAAEVSAAMPAPVMRRFRMMGVTPGEML